MSSNAVEKDLEKFIKFLALKSTQVVVQSRLGEKFQTHCNPHASGNDWFNIVIEDHPDVSAETKKALNLSQSETILNRLPLCVEISLRTVDGDQMILEVWSLELSPDGKNDPQLKAAHAIYNRMSILLKSLISLTRATPAYKLSRRQSTDSYNIYYRIYVEKPQVHTLGEGYKHFRIGQLSTIVGTLNMSVAYRTKMTISPTQAGRDSAIMLKSDHFLKDLSPKHVRYHHVKKSSDKKVVDIDKPLRPGAFVDISKIKQFTEEDYILPETPPFSWLIRRTTNDSLSLGSNSSNANSPDYQITTGFPSNNNNNNNLQNFKNIEYTDLRTNSTISGTSPVKSLFIPVVVEESKPATPTPKPMPSEDENLLKELHFPFASATSHVGDLAKFYRDCHHAPPLHICVDPAPEEQADAVEDLSKQLEEFEASLEDYDYLVSTLACSTSKTSSNSN